MLASEVCAVLVYADRRSSVRDRARNRRSARPPQSPRGANETRTLYRHRVVRRVRREVDCQGRCPPCSSHQAPRRRHPRPPPWMSDDPMATEEPCNCPACRGIYIPFGSELLEELDAHPERANAFVRGLAVDPEPPGTP